MCVIHVKRQIEEENRWLGEIKEAEQRFSFFVRSKHFHQSRQNEGLSSLQSDFLLLFIGLCICSPAAVNLLGKAQCHLFQVKLHRYKYMR